MVQGHPRPHHRSQPKLAGAPSIKRRRIRYNQATKNYPEGGSRTRLRTPSIVAIGGFPLPRAPAYSFWLNQIELWSAKIERDPPAPRQLSRKSGNRRSLLLTPTECSASWRAFPL